MPAVRLQRMTWFSLAALVGRTDLVAVARPVAVPPADDKAARKAAAVLAAQTRLREVQGRVRWGRGCEGRLEVVIEGAPRGRLVWTQDAPMADLQVDEHWFCGPVEVWVGQL